MSKIHETQKNVKKAPKKSMKEKRAEKRLKRAGKDDYNKVRKIIETPLK